MNINKEVYANVKKNFQEINEWENEQIRLFHQNHYVSSTYSVPVKASIKDIMEIGDMPVELHKVGNKEYKSAVINLQGIGTKNYEMALEIIEAILSASKVNKVITDEENGTAKVVTRIPFITYRERVIENKEYDNHIKTSYLDYTVEELMEIPYNIQPWDEGTVFYVKDDPNNINPILMQSLFRAIGADVLCEPTDYISVDGEMVHITKYYTNLPWGYILSLENTNEELADELIIENIIDDCLKERYSQLEDSGECDPEFEMNEENEEEWLDIRDDLMYDEISGELNSLTDIEELKEYALDVICMPGYKVCELDKIKHPNLVRAVIERKLCG